MRVAFSLGGAAIDVVVPDAVWAARVTALFPDYAGPPSRAAAETLLLEPSGMGGAVTAGATVTHADSESDLISALEAAVARSLLGLRSEWVHLHAAGAVVDGGSILLVGGSGAGKSNLAMALHESGRAVLGDDIVLLSMEGEAWAFRRLMKLDVERAREWGLPVEETPSWDPEHEEVWYDPRVAVGWADGLFPVRAVFAVRFDAASPGRIRPMSETDALSALIHEVLPTGRSAADGIDALAVVVRAAELFEIVFSDARAAVATIELQLQVDSRGAG